MFPETPPWFLEPSEETTDTGIRALACSSSGHQVDATENQAVGSLSLAPGGPWSLRTELSLRQLLLCIPEPRIYRNLLGTGI